jgi:hypothetical protein
MFVLEIRVERTKKLEARYNKGKRPKVIFHPAILIFQKQDSILLNITKVKSALGECLEEGQPLTKQKNQNIHLFICGNSC